MKKRFNVLECLLVVLMMVTIVSCSDEDPQPDTGGNGFEVETDVTLSGTISAQTLTADKTYALDGIVSIVTGELKIEAGTKIYGKEGSTLVIGKDATINAVGTATNPIIFTSSKLANLRATGDWAGIVIVGKAHTAGRKSPVEGFPDSAGDLVEFGTSWMAANNVTADDAHNSGKFQYVRIEYAGYELTPNNEINSLTLAGVGSGTTIDHIQIVHAKDDAVEIFGGKPTVKYYISGQTQDDDVDLDDGFRGVMQYGLVWKNAKVSDASGSSGIESGDKTSDDYKQGYTLSNFTFFGPTMNASKDFAGFIAGVQLKGTHTGASITDCIFAGWEEGTEGEKEGEFFGAGEAGKNTGLTFTGNVFAGGQAAGEYGEATEYQADNDVTNLAADGYQTIFPNAGTSLEGQWSGFTANAITPSANYSTKGATAGTDWNLSSGWVIFDLSNVSY